MFFGLWKKKRKPADPLAAFDQLIEDLERQGAEIRKSAATLLALRGELGRAAARYSGRLEDIAVRLAEAGDDARSVAVLERDREQTRALLDSTRESLARAEQDGRLLLEAASELGDRVAELRTERASASARLAVGGLVTQALRERVEQFEKVLAVDAARDEIERAHALADVYREARGERTG